MVGTVLIGCPTCGRRYRYDAVRFGSQGVRIRCRTCEAVMRVDIPAALQPASGDVPGIHEPQASSHVVALSRPREVDTTGAKAQTATGQQDGDAPEAADLHGAGHTPGRPRALVAEQDPVLRDLFTGSLQDEGYQVKAVEDGLEVRRLLAGWPPRLVVLNVFLPHVLGVTLCSEIKRHPQLNQTRVLLVGSLYRRDRFMRHPDDLYGADGFLDGNGKRDEMHRELVQFCRAGEALPSSVADTDGDEWDELTRLARIVVGDIILYNPDTADGVMASGTFLQAFAQEIREGEALVRARFGHLEGHGQVYHQTVKDAVERHRSAAGMPAGLRT